MKHVVLLAAVLIVTSSWARPARAQLGILDLPSSSGIGHQFDRMRNLAKKKQTNSLPPPPLSASTSKRAHSGPAFRGDLTTADRFGRLDLVGHQVSGYPAIRGDLNAANASRVSRGGANGRGGKVIAASRPRQ